MQSQDVLSVKRYMNQQVHYNYTGTMEESGETTVSEDNVLCYKHNRHKKPNLSLYYFGWKWQDSQLSVTVYM